MPSIRLKEGVLSGHAMLACGTPDAVDRYRQAKQAAARTVLEAKTSGLGGVRVLEGLWEFAQPVHMCFVDLEKAFDRVPRGILWGVLHEYGVRGPLLRAVRSLYDRSRSLVRIAGSASQPGPSACAGAVCSRVSEAAGMRISTSKSEAMVLDRKRVACPLSGGLVQRPGAVMRSVYRTVPGEEGAEPKRKRSSRFTPVNNLRFPPHPIVMNFG
ncbi:hypothetical protein L3Q82_017590 [Scortum barcoo]|uniref:Uncharacterized protein n=1 Tax=Scortum barcoo TaxID=214431 RepID=A0ACB8VPE3_9TELE|nr:hypothetical protein L3Q82_017590 [Scortum barcoo]